MHWGEHWGEHTYQQESFGSSELPNHELHPVFRYILKIQKNGWFKTDCCPLLSHFLKANSRCRLVEMIIERRLIEVFVATQPDVSVFRIHFIVVAPFVSYIHH